MPRPGNPTRRARQARRTIRNLLQGSYPWPGAANATYEAADFVELASLAMGRGLSLHMASQAHPGLPDSDTFHHHLHGVTAKQVVSAFEANHQALLQVAQDLGWVEEPVMVAIDRHNEPQYGHEQAYMVGMERKAGTNRAHAYLTSQRLSDPRLILGVELLNPLRGQSLALARLLEQTLQRQRVQAFLLDKGFYTIDDLALLVATKAWFVVPVPLTKQVHQAADDLFRTRQSVGLGRHVATRRYGLGDEKRGVDVTQVFVWEPDPDHPGDQVLFVYACPHDLSVEELDGWAQSYRRRWGIETGYRQIEALRLRTTSHVYANRLYLSLVAILLDTAWRLLRHAHVARGEPAPLTVPMFCLSLEPVTDPLAA